MSKNINPILEAKASESEITTRMLVTIYTEDSSNNVFRFVVGDEELSFENNLYIPADIKRGEITINIDGSKEQVDLTFGNSNASWAGYIANYGNTLNSRKCVIEEVFLDNLEEGSVILFTGVLNKIKMNLGEFKVTVEREGINFSQEAPYITYDVHCPYIFKDEYCQSTSVNFTKCDGTVTSCTERGNITRFGGHPSIPEQMVIK